MTWKEKVLRRAIAERHSVIAFYDSYSRVFSPCVLGTGVRRADKRRVKRVLAYQFAGSGQSNKPLGWRCFEVERLRFLVEVPFLPWQTGEVSTNRGNNGCIDQIELEA